MNALALCREDAPGLPGLFSKATRARLLTQWPHAGIVIDGTMTHCTLSGGLHLSNWNAAHWDVVPLPESLVPRLRQRYQERAGAKYDAISLLAFLLPWRISDDRRMYCYEWCWYAMTGANPHWRVTPEQLLWLAHRMRDARP